MFLPDDPTLAYIVVALVAIAYLPWFGERIYAFRRVRDNYLADRSRSRSVPRGRDDDPG